MTAPVALFVYNRPDHTARTLQALEANPLTDQTDLYVFADGPRTEQARPAVEAVRELVSTLPESGRFRSVTVETSEANRGLAPSIIAGVSKVLEAHETCIVLEDDLITAPGFLAYMNGALEFYADDPTVGSIGAYSPLEHLPDDYLPDVYAVRRTSSHGWAVWRDRWAKVDWSLARFAEYERSFAIRQGFNACGSDRGMRLRRQVRDGMRSWSVVFGLSQFLDGYRTVFPRRSLIRNIGNDGSGENVGAGTRYNEALANDLGTVVFQRVKPDARIERALYRINSGSFPSQVRRFVLDNLPALRLRP